MSAESRSKRRRFLLSFEKYYKSRQKHNKRFLQ
jgi:hypothetical protein